MAILAGNYEQYKDYINRQPIRPFPNMFQFIYINKIEDIIGNRFDDYKIIGTFYDKKNAFKILDEVKARTI
ncbi:MAG TPA: hypothetical protein PKJ10_05195 [Smithella sp.]|nr:hypothetical protein [Smithella sp.]